MSGIPRNELKKNELEEIVLKIIFWIKNNKQVFIGAASTVGIICFFAVFLFMRLNTMKTRSADKLSMAQGMIYQGQIDNGMKVLDEIISQYSRTESSFKARLLKAEYLILEKKYEEAEKAVFPVVLNGKPKNIIPLAAVVLGTIQEDRTKFTEAVQTYNSFLSKYSDHFLAPKVYESLGRVYEMLGSKQEAKNAYEKLSTLYPATGWAQRAQEKIAEISSSMAGAAPDLKKQVQIK